MLKSIENEKQLRYLKEQQACQKSFNEQKFKQFREINDEAKIQEFKQDKYDKRSHSFTKSVSKQKSKYKSESKSKKKDKKTIEKYDKYDTESKGKYRYRSRSREKDKQKISKQTTYNNSKDKQNYNGSKNYNLDDLSSNPNLNQNGSSQRFQKSSDKNIYSAEYNQTQNQSKQNYWNNDQNVVQTINIKDIQDSNFQIEISKATSTKKQEKNYINNDINNQKAQLKKIEEVEENNKQLDLQAKHVKLEVNELKKYENEKFKSCSNSSSIESISEGLDSESQQQQDETYNIQNRIEEIEQDSNNKNNKINQIIQPNIKGTTSLSMSSNKEIKKTNTIDDYVRKYIEQEQIQEQVQEIKNSINNQLGRQQKKERMTDEQSIKCTEDENLQQNQNLQINDKNQKNLQNFQNYQEKQDISKLQKTKDSAVPDIECDKNIFHNQIDGHKNENIKDDKQCQHLLELNQKSKSFSQQKSQSQQQDKKQKNQEYKNEVNSYDSEPEIDLLDSDQQNDIISEEDDQEIEQIQKLCQFDKIQDQRSSNSSI